MPIGESANLPDLGGSKTAEPSTDLNDPTNLNFEDSDDDQNTQDDGAERIESETDEASEDDGQESDDPQDDATEESDADGDEPDADDKAEKVVITLKGGEQVPLEELKHGYMRDRDYRHKTQELSNKGRNLDEMASRVTKTVDAFATFLAQQLPDEPSPTLAMQNPQEYTRQKAIYDAALSQVNQIISMGAEPKNVAATLTEAQRNEVIATENAKLLEAFPQTGKKEGREKFFGTAYQTARDFGFSDAEFKDIVDHRMFKLAHYASLGIQAEQARSKAMTKVNNAPPAVANSKSKGAASQKVRANQDAMKKLAKTGSIQDAMSIDFD